MIDSPMAMLQTQKARLANVAGVVSCEIGLEANVSPDDYPLIRLVPIRLQPGGTRRRRVFEFWVYFGVNVHEFQGLEVLYNSLLTMEQEIVERVLDKIGGIAHLETLSNDIQGLGTPAYRIMVARFESRG